MKKALCLSLVAAMSLQTMVFAAVQVHDSRYKAEIFAKNFPAYGSREIAVDSTGNLYLTQGSSGVSKVTPTGQATPVWVSGFSNACGIEYTKGSAFGDNFYVCDIDGGRVKKVTSSGLYSTFAFFSGPTMIALDQNGNYNNRLYVTTSGDDRIYSLNESGQSQLFCNTFYKTSGCIQGIDFSPVNTYGNSMYISTWFPANPTTSGIFKVDTNGTPTKFNTQLAGGFTLHFDTLGFFDNAMYVSAIPEFNQVWNIYKINEAGQSVLFLTSDTQSLSGFNFGADGAMYVSGAYNLWKISPIPEPTTFILLAAGCTALRKRK